MNVRKLTGLFFATALAVFALTPLQAEPRYADICVEDCSECPAYCYNWICVDVDCGIACRCY